MAHWHVPYVGYLAMAVRNVFVLVAAVALAALAIGISLIRRSGSDEIQEP